MELIENFVGGLNSLLFSEYVVLTLVVVGLLFTIWSFFGQYRALTHGVAVVRGKYDDKSDPGAINHFQALSAALSATVGLGNIAGVALAVALGGPGAIMWMWLIGLLGMALKMTEVTQSMLFRNTSDPDNPHGGPMFVIQKGLTEKPGLRFLAAVFFSIVSLGLMAIALATFGDSLEPSQRLGIIGAGVGFSVLFWASAMIGGRFLGSLIGGLFVITLIIAAITGGNMFQAWNVADTTRTNFGLPQVATGIILATVVGLVIIGGIKRIGAVAGRIVPLMCAIYVLAGIYVLIVNIDTIPDMFRLIIVSGLPDWLGGANAEPSGAFLGGTFGYAAMWGIKRAMFSSESGQGSSPIAHSAAKTDEPVREGVVAGLEPFIDTIVVCTLTALVILSSGAYNRPPEAFFDNPSQVQITQVQDTDDDGNPIENTWTVSTPAPPKKTIEARRILLTEEGKSGWNEGESVFVIVHAEEDENTGRDIRKITGSVTYDDEAEAWAFSWNKLESSKRPVLVGADGNDYDGGVFVTYAGSSLTSHAFDRVTPGLGKYLVTLAAWLFAISTMISWSYYGEQGIYYLCERLGDATTTTVVLGYKLVYCLLILLTTVAAMPYFGPDGDKAIIGTDAQLDMWTSLGLGVMLIVNIPIMLLFSAKAMNALHEYIGRLKRGQLDSHAAPSITDVAEGKDVE